MTVLVPRLLLELLAVTDCFALLVTVDNFNRFSSLVPATRVFPKKRCPQVNKVPCYSTLMIAWSQAHAQNVRARFCHNYFPREKYSFDFHFIWKTRITASAH